MQNLKLHLKLISVYNNFTYNTVGFHRTKGTDRRRKMLATFARQLYAQETLLVIEILGQQTGHVWRS